MDNLAEQIQELAKAHEDGIDTVATGIQDLYKVIDHLTNQLRTADILLASLKFLLLQKNVISDRELEDMQAKIIKYSNKQIQDMIPDENDTTADTMEGELKIIHDAAKKAAETPYDADAFIFGS